MCLLINVLQVKLRKYDSVLTCRCFVSCAATTWSLRDDMVKPALGHPHQTTTGPWGGYCPASSWSAQPVKLCGLLSLNIDTCTPSQPCIHTPFPTPTLTPSHKRWTLNNHEHWQHGFPGVTLASNLHYICCCCKLATSSNCVYPMYFTC